MSKPAVSPALIGPTGFATLAIAMFAHLTLIEPLSELLPCCASASFDAATDARFGISSQLAPLVRAVRVIVLEAPGARSPKLHERTSGFGTVLMEQDAALAPPRAHG